MILSRIRALSRGIFRGMAVFYTSTFKTGIPHMPLIKKILVLCFFLNLAAISAFADEWENTTAEDMGISQEEFQKVKESGMSKSRFLKLLEVGISPNEYFSEPWKKLGVTEDHWLNEKKAGMADDDIDLSYRKQ